jgi:acetylornithine/succinyldiaminopimelate/putrescine aminotransferase
MREDGVLVGIEGVHGNILKIRPPLVFSQVNADQLIAALDRALESIGSDRFAGIRDWNCPGVFQHMA